MLRICPGFGDGNDIWFFFSNVGKQFVALGDKTSRVRVQDSNMVLIPNAMRQSYYGLRADCTFDPNSISLLPSCMDLIIYGFSVPRPLQ